MLNFHDTRLFLDVSFFPFQLILFFDLFFFFCFCTALVQDQVINFLPVGISFRLIINQFIWIWLFLTSFRAEVCEEPVAAIDRIYIYKTVVSDRVLTLYRLCAYPTAVPQTCLWSDGSPKFVTMVLSVHQIFAPGIVQITVLQKANQTQPLKNQQLYFENEAFLIKRFFSTLSWFCGLVRPRFKIWPSTYRPYVVSTNNRCYFSVFSSVS